MTFSFQMVQLICICGMEGSFLKKSGTHGKDAKKKINSFESIFCLSNISSIRFNWFCRVFLKQILFFNLSMLHVLTACFAQSCVSLLVKHGLSPNEKRYLKVNAIVQRGVTCSYYWRPHWCRFFFQTLQNYFTYFMFISIECWEYVCSA